MVHETVSLKGELENLELNQYLQRSDILRQTENQRNGSNISEIRGAFESLEEFVQWYNKRPHGALKLEQLKSSQDAFWNRLPIEAKFKTGMRLFGL